MKESKNKILNFRFVIAFIQEAKPIINFYSLKYIETENNLYKIYRNQKENIWLVISGIGNIQAASATTFLYQQSPKSIKNIWINIGIAGHHNILPGSIFNIKKVSRNNDLSDIHYTNSVLNDKISNYEVLNVEKYEREFSTKNKIYEMEAYGFIKIVEKFCNRELICIIKIISDNGNKDLKEIKGLATEVIEKNINKIQQLLLSYYKLSTHINEFNSELLGEVKKKFNYSFTNKHKINKLLMKLENIIEKKQLIQVIRASKNINDLINKFENKLLHYKLEL